MPFREASVHTITILWIAAGIHHAVHAPAERPGGTDDPDFESAMRSSPPLRKPATYQPGHWRLDWLLQQSAPASGAGNENARRSVPISGVS